MMRLTLLTNQKGSRSPTGIIILSVLRQSGHITEVVAVGKPLVVTVARKFLQLYTPTPSGEGHKSAPYFA